MVSFEKARATALSMVAGKEPFESWNAGSRYVPDESGVLQDERNFQLMERRAGSESPQREGRESAWSSLRVEVSLKRSVRHDAPKPAALCHHVEFPQGIFAEACN